jgi:hypothetical protein
MIQPCIKSVYGTRSQANISARAIKLLRRQSRNYNPPGHRYPRFNQQRPESMSVNDQCFATRNTCPDFAL